MVNVQTSIGMNLARDQNAGDDDDDCVRGEVFSIAVVVCRPHNARVVSATMIAFDAYDVMSAGLATAEVRDGRLGACWLVKQVLGSPTFPPIFPARCPNDRLVGAGAGQLCDG